MFISLEMDKDRPCSSTRLAGILRDWHAGWRRLGAKTEGGESTPVSLARSYQTQFSLPCYFYHAKRGERFCSLHTIPFSPVESSLRHMGTSLHIVLSIEPST
jgi:hypothetical protein